MTYNPDIHHRRSIRLKEYDYSGIGAYYVTLCTFQRECLFGDVVTGEMRLNDMGLIVRDCWQRIPAHFSCVEVDDFVVMPNHFHAVLRITESVGPIHVGAKQDLPASPAFGEQYIENKDTDKNQGEADEAFASPLQEPFGKRAAQISRIKWKFHGMKRLTLSNNRVHY